MAGSCWRRLAIHQPQCRPLHIAPRRLASLVAQLGSGGSACRYPLDPACLASGGSPLHRRDHGERLAAGERTLSLATSRRLGAPPDTVALIGAAPAAYGWVAPAGATIGELSLSFALPAGDRYLWDFAT